MRNNGKLADRSGFTLVEILIVITVIALLVAISLTVAVRSASSGKVRATEHILKTLDSVVTEFAAQSGGKIPAMVKDDFGNLYPMVDGTLEGGGPEPQPSLSIFLLEATRQHLTEGMLHEIDSQFIERDFVPAAAFVSGGPLGGAQPGLGVFEGLRVLDGFGNRIRLVHPAFHGGYGKYFEKTATGFTQENTTRANLIVKEPGGTGTLSFSRSCIPAAYVYDDKELPFGDADEGRCLANRPYVYSCGIDGNPGTRMDNIYVGSKPQWPAETVSIFLD